MNILVSGSRGFIGSALVKSLGRAGHHPIRLVRSPSRPTEGAVIWDPLAERIDSYGLSDIEAVVHLAGESIAEGKWTDERKDAIHESRVAGTKFLAQAVARLRNPPRVFVSASAVGFYGDRGDEILDESSSRGTGFLSDLCWQWEAACDAATRKGIRVVNTRFGLVLGDGGLLRRLLPIFRLGFGGKLGSGRQYMSWIALADVVGGIEHAIVTDSLVGPVNFVSPDPVTNAEFTRALAAAVNRNAYYTVPAFALRLAYGQMADEMLLASARAVPKKLEESGYKFKHERLEDALAAAIRE